MNVGDRVYRVVLSRYAGSHGEDTYTLEERTIIQVIPSAVKLDQAFSDQHTRVLVSHASGSGSRTPSEKYHASAALAIAAFADRQAAEKLELEARMQDCDRALAWCRCQDRGVP